MTERGTKLMKGALADDAVFLVDDEQKRAKEGEVGSLWIRSQHILAQIISIQSDSTSTSRFPSFISPML